MRTIRNFSEGWLFRKPGEEAISVTLPHTWNALDGQDGGNDYWRGTATYEKRFARPELKDGERCYIEFGGAAMTADVTLNGAHLAHHQGGYSTFRVDLTDALQEENLLLVAVDNSDNDRVYPQKADFTFYGGACRDEMQIRRVDRPNPAYAFGDAGPVVNWFDKEDLKPGFYSIKDKFGELMQNPATAAIVGRIMAKATASRGDVAKEALQQMMAVMSFEGLLKKAGANVVPPEMVKSINDALQQIPKK